MYKGIRVTVLLALLVAMLLSTALSGCGAKGIAKAPATEPPHIVAERTPIWPAALTAKTAVPSMNKALAAFSGPLQTPGAFSPATGAKAGTTPTPEGAQTITQEIVISSEGGEGGMGYSGTFTMTARIQVGVVGGINYTSDAAPMPKGAKPYDVAKLPEIGDAVQTADGIVVQVNGWRTVDVDDDNQFVLVDLILGNAGKERQLVTTNPCMEIVSGDGHWYSAFWDALYWTAIGDDAYVLAQGQDLHDKYLANDVTTDFSVALDPGKAAKGTAVFPVPKSAKELAFGFQTYLASTYLFFGNEASPTVFVPLGLEGNFPAIPGDVEDLEAGATYQVGESFKAPERGVAFQVQSAWARQESLGNMWELGPSEQFVVVNAIAPADKAAKALDQTRELALVDDSGNSFELQEWASDYRTVRLGAYSQRGVLVFKGPRDATGLKLQFIPLDPATMAGDSPEPLADEAVTIELGEIPIAPEVGTSAVAEPGVEATATPQAKSGTGTLKRGQRAVAGDLAVTVTGAELQDGPEDFEAGEGNTWVLAYVTVENVSKQDTWVDPSSFDFVGKTGVVYNNLVNRPSAWDAIRDSILDYASLISGGALEDQVLLIQIKKTAVPGLKVRFRTSDGTSILWDLGL